MDGELGDRAPTPVYHLPLVAQASFGGLGGIDDAEVDARDGGLIITYEAEPPQHGAIAAAHLLGQLAPGGRRQHPLRVGCQFR